ncbi:MAG: hypothetical protein HQL73_01940 [Magnetococcales bacterium]|nr:hypothetical protein [Magnetococcales bacterium]
MEVRLYFVIGDLMATTFCGWLTAVTVSHWISSTGSMVLAMGLGMAVGIMIGMVTALGFMPFFGAMEVMLPVMLAGKLSGMLVAMGSVMHWLPMAWMDAMGMLSGVLAFLWTTLAQYRVKDVYGH